MCDSIIICDDMQVQLKECKILTEMVLNKKHKNLEVIQCEQYTHISRFSSKNECRLFCIIG